ncbi:hypothetical protein [Azohydromonas aeria]|uniref:hypothetical protein n=1 Tax=Azohydromonas aeria TaxID=2590212 RepID=UPI0012F93978|nr:hypothetical protein [Azohydromonas aeria]
MAKSIFVRNVAAAAAGCTAFDAAFLAMGVAFFAATFLVATVFLVGIVGYSLNGTNGVVTAGIIDATSAVPF